MDADFWLQRWHEGRIGFHRDEVMPLLERHWAALGVPAGGRVFVPLAGKTLDMHWLAAQGHEVLGVELSPLAVRAFFADAGLRPAIHADAEGVHHRAGPVDLVLGDVFALSEQLLAPMDAVYDRAAIIALPAAMRRRYVSEVYAKLPRGCRGLLITLEYPQDEKEGPPFSVSESEVRTRFGSRWDVDLLERRDILATQQNFIDEGVTALDTCVYRLHRHS